MKTYTKPAKPGEITLKTKPIDMYNYIKDLERIINHQKKITAKHNRKLAKAMTDQVTARSHA